MPQQKASAPEKQDKMAMETWTLIASHSYLEDAKDHAGIIHHSQCGGLTEKAISGWKWRERRGSNPRPSA